MKNLITGSLLAFMLIVIAAFSGAPPARVAGPAAEAVVPDAPPPFYWVCHFPGHNTDFQMPFGPINADGTSACVRPVGGALVSGTSMYLPQVPCNVHTGTTCV